MEEGGSNSSRNTDSTETVQLINRLNDIDNVANEVKDFDFNKANRRGPTRVEDIYAEIEVISPVKYTPKLRAQPAEYAEISTTTPDKQPTRSGSRGKRDQMFSSVTQRYHHHDQKSGSESEDDVFAMQRRLRKMAAQKPKRGASLRERKPTNDIFESSTDRIFERLDLKKSEPRLSPFDWLEDGEDERPGTSSAASILSRSRNPSARSRIPSSGTGEPSARSRIPSSGTGEPSGRSRIPSNKSSGEPEILTLPIIPIFTDEEKFKESVAQTDGNDSLDRHLTLVGHKLKERTDVSCHTPCGVCAQPLGTLASIHLDNTTFTYHQACFNCKHCNVALLDRNKLLYNVFVVDGQPYCDVCIRKMGMIRLGKVKKIPTKTTV
eukprot:sb/3465693/